MEWKQELDLNSVTRNRIQTQLALWEKSPTEEAAQDLATTEILPVLNEALTQWWSKIERVPVLRNLHRMPQAEWQWEERVLCARKLDDSKHVVAFRDGTLALGWNEITLEHMQQRDPMWFPLVRGSEPITRFLFETLNTLFYKKRYLIPLPDQPIPFPSVNRLHETALGLELKRCAATFPEPKCWWTAERAERERIAAERAHWQQSPCKECKIIDKKNDPMSLFASGPVSVQCKGIPWIRRASWNCVDGYCEDCHGHHHPWRCPFC